MEKWLFLKSRFFLLLFLDLQLKRFETHFNGQVCLNLRMFSKIKPNQKSRKIASLQIQIVSLNTIVFSFAYTD